MTIYCFEGDDGSRKTTLSRAVSQVLGIPLWERGPYLPHHGAGDRMHEKGTFWYILDEMRTLDLLLKLDATVITDRHPAISEIVFRRLEHRDSVYKYLGSPYLMDLNPFGDIFVVLCKLEQPSVSSDVLETYKDVMEEFHIRYVVVDTNDMEQAINKAAQVIRGRAPPMKAVTWTKESTVDAPHGSVVNETGLVDEK